MSDFSSIIQEINQEITTNGAGSITGAKLNAVLRNMIAAVDANKTDIIPDNALYGGIVNPSDKPTYGDDHRYYYLALSEGRYVNFYNYEVDSNAVLFYWNNNNWGYVPLWITSQFLATLLTPKADKVIRAVQGNLAGLDDDGNLIDSGIASNDVVTRTEYNAAIASLQQQIDALVQQ